MNHIEQYQVTVQLRFNSNKEDQTIIQMLLDNDRFKDAKKQDKLKMIKEIKNQEIDTFLKTVQHIDPIELKEMVVMNIEPDFIKDALIVEKQESQKKTFLIYGTQKSQKLQLYKVLTRNQF